MQRSTSGLAIFLLPFVVNSAFSGRFGGNESDFDAFYSPEFWNFSGDLDSKVAGCWVKRFATWAP